MYIFIIIYYVYNIKDRHVLVVTFNWGVLHLCAICTYTSNDRVKSREKKRHTEKSQQTSSYVIDGVRLGRETGNAQGLAL